MSDDSGGIRFGFHAADGVELHYAAAGNPENPLIICLHGFPEYWAAWREVMTALADRYHLVAPDQRGFNLSSKPQGVDAYRARHMVADLAGLADRLSPEKPFVLAGHDWGASIAYAYAFAHPGRLSHLIIANGVHPACFQRAIFEDEAQRRASQYINRLRAPDADTLMSEDGFRRTRKMISGFSRTDWMTEEIRADYLRAWSEPGAMTAMLNWYRASPIAVPLPGEQPGDSFVLSLPDEAMAVRMPHLVVWGEADEALRPVCLEGLDRYARDLTIRKFAGAGHWILHEKPAEVAGAIRLFLGRA
ncbi:alpha/beta fold hydrolase [Mesorhizobium sp. ZC-5]|uniref:alpha/beta fold hydrolase n=1 Tax=Mesorhizobium sp. ZC-5 TaxID=2986066 RepID=UPI0021E81345|nr:alpha/beta hydrolase [Mesorhizobium sp. ZC-5]MCV3241450.1 alpha/beta hydrolase [Mesorhizobium sp. ZC-5]